jgi:hypothetical protein
MVILPLFSELCDFTSLFFKTKIEFAPIPLRVFNGVNLAINENFAHTN